MRRRNDDGQHEGGATLSVAVARTADAARPVLSGGIQPNSPVNSPERLQPLLLHVREVCELTGYSKAHVHRLIARGELPCVRSGRAVRVPRAALLRWIADQCGQPLDLPGYGETAGQHPAVSGEAA